MSRSRGKLHKACCCPWCGTRTLVRDYFNPATNSLDSCVSYICTACHTGFSIRDSPRAQFVNRMYAAERRQRPRDAEHHPRGGAPPLSARSDYEVNRIYEVLLSKKPRTKAGKEANAAQLADVKAELARRTRRKTTLTYTIGELYPPGSLPEPYVQLED